MTAFAKARVRGPGAAAFLNRLVANRLPRVGRVALCHALNTRGGVHSEFTIHREAEDRFYLVSAGALQRLDHDWLRRWMPNDGSVVFEDLTSKMGVLVVAGPKSRELLSSSMRRRSLQRRLPLADRQGRHGGPGAGEAPAPQLRRRTRLGNPPRHRVPERDLRRPHGGGRRTCTSSPSAFAPWTPCASRSPTGMVGTELSIEYARLGIRPGPLRALGEGGLHRPRRPPLLAATRLRQRLRHPGGGRPADADPLGNNPLYLGSELVGRTTGGNYGFRVQKSLALAMLRPELAAAGTALEIDVLGERCPARVIDESPWDPANERLRS